MFWVVYHSRVERIPIDGIMHNYKTLSLEKKMEVNLSASNLTKFEKKLRQGAEAFQKKEKQFKYSKKCQEYESKKRDFMSLFEAQNTDEKASSEYLFNDSDNDYEKEDIFEPIIQKKNYIYFDENKERENALSRLTAKNNDNIQNLINSVELNERKRYRVRPT